MVSFEIIKKQNNNKKIHLAYVPIDKDGGNGDYLIIEDYFVGKMNFSFFDKGNFKKNVFVNNKVHTI